MKSTVYLSVILLIVGVGSGRAGENGSPIGPLSEVSIQSSIDRLAASGVDTDLARQLTQRMLDYRFNRDQVSQSHQLLLEAADSDLPIQPLADKAFEGMAKGVPPDRIVSAMQTVLARYSYADAMVRSLSPNRSRVRQLTSEMAACLSAGLTRSDLQRVAASLGSRRDTESGQNLAPLWIASLETAKEMARLGVSSQAVSKVIEQSMEQGYSTEEMQQLRSTFNDDAKISSATPLAMRYAEGIASGLKAGQIHNSISSPGAFSAEHGFQSGPGSGSSGGHGGGAGGAGGGSGGGPGGGSGGNSGGGGGRH